MWNIRNRGFNEEERGFARDEVDQTHQNDSCPVVFSDVEAAVDRVPGAYHRQKGLMVHYFYLSSALFFLASPILLGDGEWRASQLLLLSPIASTVASLSYLLEPPAPPEIPKSSRAIFIAAACAGVLDLIVSVPLVFSSPLLFLVVLALGIQKWESGLWTYVWAGMYTAYLLLPVLHAYVSYLVAKRFFHIYKNSALITPDGC